MIELKLILNPRDAILFTSFLSAAVNSKQGIEGLWKEAGAPGIPPGTEEGIKNIIKVLKHQIDNSQEYKDYHAKLRKIAEDMVDGLIKKANEN